MKLIYLNQANGIKPPLIKRVRESPDRLLLEFTSQLRNLLCLSEKDFLSLSQNTTTSLIYALISILSKEDHSIFISTHEIRWFEKLFKIGELPVHETTYPNYASQQEIIFLKKKIFLFDPNKFIENPEKIIGVKKSIVIMSDISRMTGQIFLSHSLYKKIKQLNKENILIIDGAESVGVTPVNPKKNSDVYLGLTYKFIGAEPTIGFCWVRKKIVEKFKIKPWTIDPVLFNKELFSAVTSIRKLTIDQSLIKKIRKDFELYLRKNEIPYITTTNQAPHILIIPWGEKSLEKTIVELGSRGFIVSHNINYSIKEPAIPGIRVSITPKTSLSDLRKFICVLLEIKNR
jgi:hypothetical protein